MLKAFNAFQITALFAAWPMAISYLQNATFRGATPAFFVACACYIVAFFVMTGCVFDQLDK